ncbi:MAG: hypothetical protein A3D67_00475 [Candidatus Lloydbacteria bacterium RIFCSPHIGHO2_02_FULL_51_22]|uniref:Protein CreA n=2 Tax=Candidatus Lloydiibacteriota TaxID=1817910 RepID=A0A1G2DDN8_9BACT|nr:MAG: hypothetical protein A3D67_00475 [Candidatus Lloydbacteria bacterium RIFCSPHIGHO2_02_FULL_51_22]OGZ14874.1 MAG: hypothetical protein A3J08_03235 [Candidatus Lloydbacteria bacterium RIFCSPLOWO2_02_FULL_51_11]
MRRVIVLVLSLLMAETVMAETIGSVDTTFRVLGSNDKIVVEAFDDPRVNGVSCYLSRAKTGGVTGSIGLAEDKSDSSVACRQVSTTISFKSSLPRQEEVFSERASILFKRIHVVRMVDVGRRMLVYLVYSDKLIDGSPKNSITAVALPTGVELSIKKE